MGCSIQRNNGSVLAPNDEKGGGQNEMEITLAERVG